MDRAERYDGEPGDGASVELSVVVAAYGCRECLESLYARLVAALEPELDSFEVIFVDDASPDDSWGLIDELAAKDSRVRAIRLSRNFGQHPAITAGIAESRGRWIAVMDCDLQDPPEELPRLYRRALEGYDVVFARRKRRRDSWTRRLGARAYFSMMNRFVGTAIQGEYGTFSVISRQVGDAYLRIGDQGRHYLFVLYWLGFRQASVDVPHAPRQTGSSSYTLQKLISHAADGVFFQTTVLLRWIVYLGFAIALAGVILAAAFGAIFLFGDPYPGWTSLAVLFLLVGGFVIMSTGVTGLYIGKIFDQVKDRPLYVIAERTGNAEPLYPADDARRSDSKTSTKRS